MKLLDDIRDRGQHPGETPAMRQFRRMVTRPVTPRLGPPIYPAETRELHGPGPGLTVGVRLSLVSSHSGDDESTPARLATTVDNEGSEGPATG